MKISFNIIYNQYYKQIYGFIYKLTFSKKDSEDIVQDIFLSLYKEMKKRKTPDNIRAWLYKCAFNKFINTNKKSKPMQLISNMGEFDNISINSIETEIFRDEKRRIITNALSKMSSKEQILLNLYNEEFSYKEISEILEIKFTSVGKTLSRVIEKLATQIKLTSHEELLEQRNII